MVRFHCTVKGEENFSYFFKATSNIYKANVKSYEPSRSLSPVSVT